MIITWHIGSEGTIVMSSHGLGNPEGIEEVALPANEPTPAVSSMRASQNKKILAR